MCTIVSPRTAHAGALCRRSVWRMTSRCKESDRSCSLGTSCGAAVQLHAIVFTSAFHPLAQSTHAHVSVHLAIGCARCPENKEHDNKRASHDYTSAVRHVHGCTRYVRNCGGRDSVANLHLGFFFFWHGQNSLLVVQITRYGAVLYPTQASMVQFGENFSCFHSVCS